MSLVAAAVPSDASFQGHVISVWMQSVEKFSTFCTWTTLISAFAQWRCSNYTEYLVHSSSRVGAGEGKGLRLSPAPLPPYPCELYSTTPGGTRIIYDRKFLLECKNSPVARTPPCCLPQTPGVTSLAQSSLAKLEELKERNESEEAMPDQDQFEMDI
ncbi:PREDICTED: eukaryotic translation initiation factor 4E-binding protein 3 [Tauraco erythrolophus]|uniref:eukaryotic translation initiation factor 4E-binding protein 3 n=1 Tax=Tauraco erythrolophus TaxID=121530 RepID=UPI000523A7DB|nr:PREDICTED: eukaryotic translation initiation factor 4E-binding protein 3 [Tauraco erythrolophus]